MSNKLKLSPWHDAQEKPEMVGVYERNINGDPDFRYSYFDGEYWSVGYESIKLAYDHRLQNTSVWQCGMFESYKWRGVLK